MTDRPSEDDLIARYFAPMAGEGGLGLRDDAALVKPTRGHEIVVTVDAVVAGVHFFAEDPPAAIAGKALGVNLSDLAAKGAVPIGFLLSLALPDDWTADWLQAFSDGLGAASRAGRCPLLGGDTVRAAGPLSISITILGEVPAGRMVRRTTALPGDLVCVTGTIGDAVLGLALKQDPPPPWAATLSEKDRNALIRRYLHPQPRNAFAKSLRECAQAAMDISDGLAGDLAKMMRASRTTAHLTLEAVPFSPAARAVLAVDPTMRDKLVTGGDDYEILFSVGATKRKDLFAAAKAIDLPVTVIGEVLAGEGPPVYLERGLPHVLPRRSFSHF